jgi:hypothetical protein
MASMFDIRDGAAFASPLVIRSDVYHKFALGNDTMGIDRNSIENDLWVNIVDVVILVRRLFSFSSEVPFADVEPLVRHSPSLAQVPT